MATYPNLPEGFETRLRAILVAADGLGGRYLDDPMCPWPLGLKQLLRPLIVKEHQVNIGAVVGAAENVFDGMEDGERFDVFLREVEETITSMKKLELEMVGDADSGDRVQVLKAKTTLLEKWISLKERTYNVKEMSDFQRIMLETMDEVLDVDQRAKVLNKLNDLKSVSGLLNNTNKKAD